MTLESQQGLLTLFAEQRASLNGYFLRRVTHAWDAQDLLQELYLRLLRSVRQRSEDIRNPEAYLYTVAANLLKEHAVMQQRAPLGSDGLDEVIERLATPCDAGADVDRQLRRQRLSQLLGQLSPKCRAVLVMHYRDELGYRQIGEQLGISFHMVKKYIVKALTVCRQGMARYD
ncbi:MAG: sigma-70 family RNA polymerase sigma factor [Dyella sp.]